MLKTRVITGVGLALAFALIVTLSHISWVLPTVAAALSMMALHELQTATGFLKNSCMKIFAAALVLLLAVIPIPGQHIVTGIAFLAALALFLWLMRRVGRDTCIPSWASWLILFMLPIFYRTMAALRDMEHGMYLLITAVLVGVLTDIAAYFVGRGLGRHKLAPVLSPHKTIEGSIGGTLISVIVLTAAAAVQPGSIRYGVLIPYLAIGSLVGQFGDLAMSAIKRITGIKDFGALLPGHGGILDRFDSMLFVLPFSYLFIFFSSGFNIEKGGIP